MSANKESIISRVQKLLNLAMDPGATEDERQLAQERADKLMVEHMIEQSELKKDDPNRSRATHSEWRMGWGMNLEFRMETERLLASVIAHAKCRYRGKVDYSDRENPHRVIVVGLPEQIAYAERLWLIVFTEMARNLFPKWDRAVGLDTNVYNFVKAGFKWRQIHELAWNELGADSGLPDPYPTDKQSSYGFAKVYGGDGGRLKRAYTREQKRLGEDKKNHTNRHGAYRASYVASYSATIGQLLREMASASKESVADTDKYALALRSTQDQADAEFYRLFPEFDPEEIRKRSAAAAAEQARRAAMTQKQRDAEDAAQERRYHSARRVYGRISDRRHDSNGWARGNKVAKSVNLNDYKAAGHKKKEIG